MIFYNKDEDKQVIVADCNCQCGSELHITKWELGVDDIVEYCMSLHSSKWDEEQLGIFGIIGRRLKRALYNLIGKDYLYMDICFKPDEFKEFIKQCEKIQK